MPKRLFVVLGVVVLAVIVGIVVAVTGDDDVAVDPDEDVTIEYVLWDAEQQPAYQAVADAFMEEHPNIEIEINQLGWGDYWDDLTRRLATGGGPDVWTNHVAYFREFAQRGQMMDLEDRIQDSDIIDLDAYMEGLADLFVHEDGGRYGVPKDWDTVAIFYNRAHLEEAGVSVEEVEQATWNPDDGGSFEDILSRLTANGRQAMAVDYDNFGAWGQTQFSGLAVSNSWTYHNEDATEFYFDDPQFIDTIQWFADMTLDTGYMASFEDTEEVPEMFASEQVSLIFDGSWMLGLHSDNLGDDMGIAMQPEGPEGRRSMFNGLSDAVNANTEHPEEAWLWAEYLGSVEAQEIVAEYGVVFPAVESATEITLDVHADQGLDTSAFTELAFDPDATFLFPLTANASEVNNIMQQTFDEIFLGQVGVEEGLTSANSEINALF